MQVLTNSTCRPIPYLEVEPQSLLATSVVVPTSTRLFQQDLGLDSSSASNPGCDFQVRVLRVQDLACSLLGIDQFAYH